GRAITVEFEDFYVVNVYVPNSQRELMRLPYRTQWEDDVRTYLGDLKKKKPVIYCGDLNVAHRDIDVCNPRLNQESAGFSPQEREKLTQLLGIGLVDTFRYLYPDRGEAYTWWNYMYKARATNAGWRIDYFLADSRLALKIEDALIYSDTLGSDHCPVGLILE
ncbi:MAG: exodeoxyribonuclease III, partial [Oscillospiraceae bacterium]|nr:exodeoxyribonuclease III [Oscillospiraceae bacterium]